MEKLLLIAEKPSLRRELEATYNAHRSDIPYDITFANVRGHVCRLLEPKEYSDWEDTKWKDYDLPLIPKTWKLGIIPDTYSLYKDIKNLLKTNKFDGIIAAEDPEREGNYIHYLMETHMGISHMKTYRIWLNGGLTDDAILDAYLNMTDFHNDDVQKRLTDAAVLRGRYDWLLGMNLTIGCTVKYNNLMNIGRVKAPVINMVYQNSMAIDNFASKTSYNLVAEMKDAFDATLIESTSVLTPIKFDTEKDAMNLTTKMTKKCKVVDFKKETTTTYAPKLFKLATVQIEAGKKFGYSPDKTLSIVQSLYEKKLVSYPRTGCEYISTSIASSLSTLLRPISVFNDLDVVLKTVKPSDIAKVKSIKKYTNDIEVKKDAHTAILPTTKIPNLSSLSVEEINILHLIYSQLLAILLPPLVEEKTSIILDDNGYIFKANGKKVINKGYTNFTKTSIIDTIIPDFKVGDVLNVNTYRADEKVTTPPKRFTQSSLIDDMNHASKYVTDAGLKKILVEVEGIGTAATQAEIVKAIIREGYVEEKKGKGKEPNLYITPKGKFYCETLKDYSFLNPGFVAQMEAKLKAVSDGDLSFNDCQNEMLSYLKSTLKEIETSKAVTFNENKNQYGTSYICPDCGKPINSLKYGYSCSGYKEGCKFQIPKVIAKKTLTEAQIDKIFKTGKTGVISGFESKTGNKFKAILKLDNSEGTSKLIFDFNVEEKDLKSEHHCPFCNGMMASDRFAWKCNCGFSVSYEVCGHKFTEKDLNELLTKGETKKYPMKNKVGKNFSAGLKLDKLNKKTELKF